MRELTLSEAAYVFGGDADSAGSAVVAGAIAGATANVGAAYAFGFTLATAGGAIALAGGVGFVLGGMAAYALYSWIMSPDC